MTDITSLNQKLTELQVKYDKKVKAYGELRKGYKIVLDHNKVLRDNSEEYFLLQEKHYKLKEAFEELLANHVQYMAVDYGVDVSLYNKFKEDWYKQAGLL